MSKSGGVQTNVSPSLQLNLDNMSNSSSDPEEPINGLPSNLGGSAHQPQLSEDEISAEEFLTRELLNYYQPLLNAAQRGDWQSAKSFIHRNPNTLTASITAVNSRTVFHVAALSCQWEFVLKLLELIVYPESLAVQDVYGNTVLHYVAQGGSLKTVKALVKKNSDLLQIVNNTGDLPLVYSLYSDSKELKWYLTLITRVVSPSLPNILCTLIGSGCYDIALYFVKRYPELALTKDEDGNYLLWWLAAEARSFFLSVSNLGFLKRWIYKFVRVEIKISPADFVMINMEDLLDSTEGFPAAVTSIQPRSFATQVLRWFKRLLWKAIAQLAPSIKMVRDTKLKHECAIELINLVCKQLSSMSFKQTLHFLQHPPILRGAVVVGVEEIEVEKITFPFQRENLNANSETAKAVFRRQHNDLAKQGEKWMKDTANSCMLVSTLIATVLFAAAFTIPGGNVNDKGIPIFLHTNAFIVFAISDALGMFSSLTSLLMFLAILTARYAIEDFLESLPKKLIIGLGSLFFAIASMIIAFGATLTIVLIERLQWVAVPITLLASFPVVIFVMLQLPLFIQIVQSTHGSSMFRPWQSRYVE
ncbi:hypothetical protein ACOSP7_020141 [Xanthoceras sorbifolium]